MTDYYSIAVNYLQNPIKMPKRDFFRLPESLRCVFDGQLMVLVNECGRNTFMAVELI